jgi:3-phosphoglycerate kinase
MADDVASTMTALLVAGGAVSTAVEVSAGLEHSAEHLVCVGAVDMLLLVATTYLVSGLAEDEPCVAERC